LAHNVAIKLGEIFSGNPILAMNAGSSGLNWILRKVLGLDLKLENVAHASIARVPVSRDLNGVTFFQNRIKDGLFRETRREGPPVRSANQRKFIFANGAV
jgi:hypothetical protein